MFDSVKVLLDEHADLQEQLADPALHADAARAKKVNRRYAELSQDRRRQHGVDPGRRGPRRRP